MDLRVDILAADSGRIIFGLVWVEKSAESAGTELSVLREARRLTNSHIQSDILCRSATTQQNVTVRGGLNRIGLITHRPRDQPGLAGVTHPRATRPFRRNVTRFGQFQEALVARSPQHGETAPRERHFGLPLGPARPLMRHSRGPCF
jgi:hypothetical protein